MTNPAGILGARTAGELIQLTAQVFADADIYYGHGTDNPVDEAAALVFHVMDLPHSGFRLIYMLSPQVLSTGSVSANLQRGALIHAHRCHI